MSVLSGVFWRQCNVPKSLVRITQDISFRVHAWKRRRSGATLRLPCMCTGRNRQVSRADDFENIAPVPLHESHSESGLRRNYICSPAVTLHLLELYMIFMRHTHFTIT